MTGVGLIGAGGMGATHARLLATEVAGARLVAVADADGARAEGVAAEAGARPAGALELIAAPDVEAVIVASPAATHEAYTLACLREGKPVLCEKPLAPDPEAALRIVAAEAALKRRLVCVGFMRRFDPGYADLKARLDGGDVGRPLLVHCAHRNPAVPADFGSERLITDSAVHEADVVRWLLGDEIARARVLAPRPSRRSPAGMRDPLLIVFEMAGGPLADVEAFGHAGYAYDIRCEVVGEGGALELQPPATVAVRRDQAAAVRIPGGYPERFGEAYRLELKAWLAAVAAGAAPPGASAWDGYAAGAACAAAVASLRGAGEAVDVAPTPRPPLYAGA